MGKTGKWFRIFLTGSKKHKEKSCEGNHNSSPASPENNPTTPTTGTPKDKKRWSFRRSSATAPPPTAKDSHSTEPPPENEQTKHAKAMAAATAAAADAALAAAQAAAAVIRLTESANERASAIQEAAAATKIQSAFRSYLARKALCALRGLVKLQALVRGHLVRKQATATLRCMQALITAQARARALRIHTVEEAKPENQRPSVHRKSTQDRLRHAYNEMDRGFEENIKIVEMDSGESKGVAKNGNSYSNRPPTARLEHRYSTHNAENHGHLKQEDYLQVSPSPSALTDMSPRTCSGHFDDYCYNTAQSSPQCYSVASKFDSAGLPFAFPPPEYAESLSYDYSLFPNYMANTQSSRAKARSQSAPKQRPADSFDRQPSRRRASMEGRNVPRAVRMQRSSSHVGATAQNYQYPWSIKLDRSTVSLVDSECGSTSTVLTNNYCRSVVTYDSQGNRY